MFQVNRKFPFTQFNSSKTMQLHECARRRPIVNLSHKNKQFKSKLHTAISKLFVTIIIFVRDNFPLSPTFFPIAYTS